MLSLYTLGIFTGLLPVLFLFLSNVLSDAEPRVEPQPVWVRDRR